MTDTDATGHSEVAGVPSEPVRGRVPDPSLFSMPGIEQPRAFMRRLVTPTPLFHLLGCRVTQVSAGGCVMTQPISGWFEINDGSVDLTATAEYCLFVTALTGAPAATYVQTVSLSLRFLRPCTLDDAAIIARGRILHAGSSFTTVETLIEDALGRGVAHATGSVVMRPMDPPPPAKSELRAEVDEPVFATPDPPRRPVPLGRRSPLPPIGDYLGMRLAQRDNASATVIMPGSEWFCRLYREVSPGIIGALGDVVGSAAIAGSVEPHLRWVVINVTHSFMAPVVADGRPLVGTGRVRTRRGNTMLVDIEVRDAGGATALVAQATVLILERRARPSARPSERLLLTVLFTDVVGSTERAQQLGDARWRELLDEHHRLVRLQLEQHKGREVKSTGDGFLATFDSPTRAVNCAKSIARAVSSLGLQIRAGVHTGECDVGGGDIAGLAVHVASRIESAAAPGELLTSSTTRELLAGSGIEFTDRGEHELKGVPGTWRLFAIAG